MQSNRSSGHDHIDFGSILKTSPRLLVGKELQEYRLISLISSGTFGAVYTAKRLDEKEGETIYAIKIFFPLDITCAPYPYYWHGINEYLALEELKDEKYICRLIQGVHGPCTLQEPRTYRSVSVTVFGVVLEKYQETLGTAIDRFFKRYWSVKKVVDGECMGWMRSLLKGLHAIHSHGLVHRDLKPHNILMANGKCHIADFGASRFLPKFMMETAMAAQSGSQDLDMPEAQVLDCDMSNAETQQDRQSKETLPNQEDMTPGIVTLWYRAPEMVLSNMHYTQSVDIWSLGCIFVEILTGKPLYSEAGKDDSHGVARLLQLHHSHFGPYPDSIVPKSYVEKYNGVKIRDASLFSGRTSRLSQSVAVPFMHEDLEKLGCICYNAKYNLEKSIRVLGENHVKQLASAICMMLELDPSKRPTTTQLLADFDVFSEEDSDNTSSSSSSSSMHDAFSAPIPGFPALARKALDLGEESRGNRGCHNRYNLSHEEALFLSCF